MADASAAPAGDCRSGFWRGSTLNRTTQLERSGSGNGISQVINPGVGICADIVARICANLLPGRLRARGQSVRDHGSKQVPMKRPGQPVELVTAYVMLADPLSRVSGATIAVNRRKAVPVTDDGLP